MINKYNIKVGNMYIRNISFEYDNEIQVDFTNVQEYAQRYSDNDIYLFIEILQSIFMSSLNVTKCDFNE